MLSVNEAHFQDDLIPSDVRDVRVMLTTVSEAIPIPTGAVYARVQVETDTWLAFAASVAKPAADVIDGGAPIFIPAGQKRVLRVKGQPALAAVNDADGLVHVDWYGN